ncbi:MAG: hypothetical protein AAFV88_01930 [Planctomycetota bacterium]
MSRRRQTLSPTLFPFLAVLVCTLGTLILLLALVAQNTNDQATKTAEKVEPERTEDPTPEPSPHALTVRQARELAEEEDFRLTELVSFRDAQAEDLGQRRDQLAHVEDHLRRIRQELQQIGAAMEKAMAEDADPNDQRAAEEKIKQLKDDIAENEAVVEKLRSEVKTGKPRFVIVPHQGPNGTDRRPIYLECTADKLVIWPEGVTIKRWQLENSSQRANPLDEALRAARYHVLQKYGDPSPPYPMMVVRPGGEETFYAAQAAMRNWDDQFGYELVPSQVELAYPNPDPEMKRRLEDVVRQASSRVSSRAVARSMSQRARGNIGRGNPGSGGTAVEQLGQRSTGNAPYGSTSRQAPGTGAAAGGTGDRSNKKFPTLSVSQMDREGRRSGFRDHRMFGGGSRFSSTPPSVAGESNEFTLADARERLERQMSASEYDSRRGSTGTQDRFAESNSIPLTGGSGNNLSMPLQNGTRIGSQAGNATNTGGSNPMFERSVSPEMRASGTESSGIDQSGSRVGNRDQGGQPLAGRPPSQRSNTPEGATGSGSTSTAPMNPYASRQASRSRQGSRSSSDTASSNSSNSSTPTSGPSSGQPASPSVRPQGKNWALPSTVRFGRGNEIVRYLTVEVYADRLVVLPSTRHRDSQSFQFAGQGIDQASLQLASTLRSRIESWGAVATGSRWSPRINAIVRPGGEAAFNQWSRRMIGSGLPIERATGERSVSGRTDSRISPR